MRGDIAANKIGKDRFQDFLEFLRDGVLQEALNEPWNLANLLQLDEF
jgi:hypothetical protein